MIDYRDISAADQDEERILTALEQMAEYGTPRSKAIALTAVSVRETDVIWTVERVNPFLGVEPGCEWRIPVGFEPSGPGGELHNGAQLDDEYKTFLAENKYGGVNSSGKFGLLPPVANKLMGDELGIIVEWILVHDRLEHLRNFSFGPTQFYMAYRGQRGMPGTREDIWDWWLSGRHGAGAVAERIVYLEPPHWGSGYPDGSPAETVPWAKGQAGTCATAYYYGGDCGSVKSPPSFKWLKESMPRITGMADTFNWKED